MSDESRSSTARERFRSDLARYYNFQSDPDSRLQRMKTILVTEGIWAIAFYRLGQYIFSEAPWPIRILLMVPYQVASKLLQLVIGIHLSYRAEIGAGLYVGHYGGIWVSPRATLGINCSISHHVTIGVAGAGRKSGPVLEDRVWVGPGATISGPVRVGSGAVIGANSLVVSNIPENAVALGVPARVISYTGSKSLLNLPD